MNLKKVLTISTVSIVLIIIIIFLIKNTILKSRPSTNSYSSSISSSIQVINSIEINRVFKLKDGVTSEQLKQLLGEPEYEGLINPTRSSPQPYKMIYNSSNDTKIQIFISPAKQLYVTEIDGFVEREVKLIEKTFSLNDLKPVEGADIKKYPIINAKEAIVYTEQNKDEGLNQNMKPLSLKAAYFKFSLFYEFQLTDGSLLYLNFENQKLNSAFILKPDKSKEDTVLKPI